MRLVLAPGRNAAAWWPAVRKRVAACCARSSGKYEPADVLRLVLAGRMQLWTAVDDAAAVRAVAITEIVSYPRRRVCRLLACTGTGIDDWWPLIAGLEAWARDAGCTALEPLARPGWERRLKSAGYRKTHIILEKTL
jgi:hypothetical protein